MGAAADGRLGVDVDDALDRVVPGIALQPAVGLEQPAGNAIALRGPPQRLRLGRLGVARHQQRVGADRFALRRLAPVVDVGEAGTPGPELGRRRGDVDVGLVRALAVREGRARVWIGGHGAVDGEPCGLAHLFEERGLDGLLARGQHQLKVRAVHDVGAGRPALAGDRLDPGKLRGDGEAVKVDVGVVEAEPVPAVLERAEHEAAPALDVERAVEEGAAVEGLASGRRVGDVLEHDGQRIVPGRLLDGPADALGVLGPGGPERDGGAVRPGRAIVGPDLRLGLARKMRGQKLDAPAGREVAVGGARPGRDGAAAPREAQHAHPCRVLSRHQVLAPAVLAERQQDGRIGDAGAVVGDGHREVAVGAGDGDADPRGAGPAAVLQGFREHLADAGGECPGDALDGAVVNAGADGRGVVHVRSP